MNKIIEDPKSALAMDMMTKKFDELGRIPKKEDFSPEEVCFIKQKLGPWPRALEKCWLKEKTRPTKKELRQEKRKERKQNEKEKQL